MEIYYEIYYRNQKTRRIEVENDTRKVYIYYRLLMTPLLVF